MLPAYMRIKDFCKQTGIPESIIRRALKSEYRNQVGRKIDLNSERNSPYLIKTAMTLKLFEGGYLK